MKKILPQSANNPSGFTTFSSHERGFSLVELLVVISIIAILSMIGVTVFSGIQKGARDARRREEIDAISKALEVNKTDTGYKTLANTMFAAGTIPTSDPQNNVYCANSTASQQPSTMSTSWTTTCPGTDFGAIGTVNPPTGTAWKICTWLESGSAYCKQNSQ